MSNDQRFKSSVGAACADCGRLCARVDCDEDIEAGFCAKLWAQGPWAAEECRRVAYAKRGAKILQAAEHYVNVVEGGAYGSAQQVDVGSAYRALKSAVQERLP